MAQLHKSAKLPCVVPGQRTICRPVLRGAVRVDVASIGVRQTGTGTPLVDDRGFRLKEVDSTVTLSALCWAVSVASAFAVLQLSLLVQRLH